MKTRKANLLLEHSHELSYIHAVFDVVIYFRFVSIPVV